MKPIVSYLDQLAAAEAQIIGVSASFAAAPKAGANPYAVLALFDASFATFSSDYADAIAALEASLADLKAAKKALNDAKGDNAKLEKAKEAAAAATGRAEHTAKFAKTVAAREDVAITTAKSVAKALGVETKDASAATEAIAAKIAAKAGVSTAQLKANAEKLSDSKLSSEAKAAFIAQAKLAVKSLDETVVKGVGEALKTVEEDLETAADRALAHGETVENIRAEAKFAAKVAEAEKAVREAKTEDIKKALEAEKKALVDNADARKQEIKAEATKAENAAKKAETDADSIKSEDLNKALEEAGKAVEKAEAAAQTAGHKVDVKGVEVIFASLADYAAFRGNKTDDALESDLKALEIAKLGTNKITEIGGYKFGALESKLVDAENKALGLKITLDAGTSKTVGGFYPVAEALADGTPINAATFVGVVKKLNDKVVGNDTNVLKITVADGVELQFSPYAASNNFSVERIKELSKITATSSLESLTDLGLAKVGDEAITSASFKAGFAAIKCNSVDYLISDKIGVKAAADMLAATAQNADAVVTAAGDKAMKIITLGTKVANDPAQAVLNALSEVSGQAANTAVEIEKQNGTKFGYLIKTANSVNWLPKDGDIVIEGVNIEAKQAAFVAADKDSTITLVKAILGQNPTKVVVNGKTINLDAAGNTMKIGEASITFPDAAKLDDLVGFDGDTKVSALVTAGVTKIGDNTIATSNKITIGTVELIHHANATLADVQGLSANSTAKQLADAGITKIGTNLEFTEVEDLITVTIGQKKYDITKAKLSDLKKFDSNQAEGNADVVEISDMEKDIKSDKQNEISSLLSNIKIGQTVVVNDNTTPKGKILKTGQDTYSWTSNDNNVRISKLKLTAKIDDLIKVAADTATFEQAKAISATGSKMSVSNAEVPAKLFGKAIDQSKQLSAFSDYKTNGTLDKLKAIIDTTTVATTIGNGELGTDGKFTLGGKKLELKGDSSVSVSDLADLATSSTVAQIADVATKVGDTTVVSATELKTNSGAVSIEGFDAAKATVATIAGLSDNATAQELKTLVDVSQSAKQLTVGDATLDIAKNATAFTITDSTANVTFTVAGSAKASEINGWASDVTTQNVIDSAKAGVFDFGNGSAPKTLDLSAYTNANNLKIAAAEGASLTASASIKGVTIQQAGSSQGTFEISTPELVGDGQNVISFTLTNWGNGDKLVLKFKEGVNKGTANSNLGSLDVNGSSSTVQTAAGSDDTHIGEIQVSESITSIRHNDSDAEAIAILEAIEADNGTAGKKGATYMVKTTDSSTNTIYLFNAGNGTQGDNDAVLVKIVGLGGSDTFAIDSAAGTVTITGA